MTVTTCQQTIHIPSPCAELAPDEEFECQHDAVAKWTIVHDNGYSCWCYYPCLEHDDDGNPLLNIRQPFVEELHMCDFHDNQMLDYQARNDISNAWVRESDVKI